MYNILELKKTLPLELDRIKVDLITNKDVEWYTEILKKSFFNEYVDYKFTNVPSAEIRFKILNLALSYKLCMSIEGEARLVIKDKVTGDYIGGCTLFEGRDNSLEIGYWILPAYQGKGYAKELLYNTSSWLKGLKRIKLLRLVIREDNIKSILLAEKCGFYKAGSFNGKYKKNLVYEVRQSNDM